MEAKRTFATRLNEAREALGVSQKQLGILAGIDEFVASARINQYERGKHMPDQLTAQRLAATLKVPVSYLYEPDDDIASLIQAAAGLSKGTLRALVKRMKEGK